MYSLYDLYIDLIIWFWILGNISSSKIIFLFLSLIIILIILLVNTSNSSNEETHRNKIGEIKCIYEINIIDEKTT